ncbi:hypothetical protein ENUP19_0173G0015 [Entamoeba nuttalli]|uniref:Uncharacterized protein n=1 Tax=Entamoeba nuttalli TaxID=412467 RepID=A0ABQ0DMN0_9EUKA
MSENRYYLYGQKYMNNHTNHYNNIYNHNYHNIDDTNHFTHHFNHNHRHKHFNNNFNRNKQYQYNRNKYHNNTQRRRKQYQNKTQNINQRNEMIEIQNQEYWKKLFEEEIKILTPQEVEEIKNTKIKEYTSSTIWRRLYFLAREKTKRNKKEEENISMTMEEDNNQYNPIEINDNRIYNNYVMSIENEDKDDKEFNKEEY